jgi:adenylate cyclase
MLDNLCLKPKIEKYRYKIEVNGFVWEVDEFLGENRGLVLAEIELPTAETLFVKPDWIGAEVSDDSRYYNSNLILHPYSQWIL